MDPKTQEDFDTWLAEVELANEYIQKLSTNELTVSEFDKKQKAKEVKIKKEEEIKKQKIIDQAEKRKQGRYGKGERENYKSFCRFCFREYVDETPNCYFCKKATIPMAERRAQLLVKVKKYQEDKVSKEERKKKWELWKKTKSMLWKKTSTNYSKWDYFTDSEEEEEDPNAEPIVPKDDPQFQAMEKDMNERAQRIKEKRQEALKYKEKGNEEMKKENWKQAITYYSFGIEAKRDFKVLYTNRALAYIKDCEKILEYCEVFEDGYIESKDLCFKALIRKCSAQIELNRITDANQSINEALKLIKNKEALDLKNQIDIILEHQTKVKYLLEEEKQLADEKSRNEKKSEQQENEITEQTTNKEKGENSQNLNDISSKLQKQNYKENLNEFINNKVFRQEKFFEAFGHIVLSDEAKIYFIEKKGMEKLLELIKDNHNVYLLLNVLIEKNIFYQQCFIKLNGIEILLDKLFQYYEEIIVSKKQDWKVEIRDIFEVLISFTHEDSIRAIIKKNTRCIDLIDKIYKAMLEKYSNYQRILQSFTSFISNLSYSDSPKVKQYFNDNFDWFIERFLKVISSPSNHIQPLKGQIFSLLSNLLNDAIFRKQMSKQLTFIKYLIFQLSKIKIQKSVKNESAEQLFALFCNLTFQGEEIFLNQLSEFKLAEKIQIILQQTMSTDNQQYLILARSAQTLSKLNLTKELIPKEFIQKLGLLFEKNFISNNVTIFVIKLIYKIFQTSELSSFITEHIPDEIMIDICSKLKQFIYSENEQYFCNTCVLGKAIILSKPSCMKVFFSELETLLKVCSDNTGQKRKNAAIFVATLAKNQENLQKIRELHGIEVLGSIQQFVLDKK